MNTPLTLLQQAQEVMQLEANSIQAAAKRLDNTFNQAVNLVLACEGRIIVSGMGKSGQIGRKITATFASLGTPSAFVHPAEALHGDLGMIRPQDLVMMLSNSGETEELLRLLWFLESQGNNSIVITGKPESTLGRHCSVALDGSIHREACHHNLAPTCSTAVAMAIGDALAVTISSKRDFQPEDFARFHPSGALGRRQLCSVAELMRRQPLPCCDEHNSIYDLISVMTSGRLGVAFVMREQQLIGIVTDGDLRRGLSKGQNLNQRAHELMSEGPLSISPKKRVLEAVAMMQKHKVSLLAVIENEQLVGAIQLFDCS
jgi:arabinose-5-phosphate isomerase